MKKYVALVVVAGVGLSGCETVPNVSKTISTVNKGVATVFGANSASLNESSASAFNATVNKARLENKLDTSSQTYRRINTVFNRMKPHADRMNKTGIAFDWKLAVLKNDTKNAYVQPGGKVVFYTGIVEKLKLTDAEIAAVMGHEMFHALEEHSKQKMGGKILTGLALQYGSAYAGLGSTGQDIAGIAAELGLDKPYSRHLETEADKGGMILMAQAGYDPKAAISVWQKMQQQNGTDKNILSFMSTHPTDSKRIQRNQEFLPEAMKHFSTRK